MCKSFSQKVRGVDLKPDKLISYSNFYISHGVAFVGLKNTNNKITLILIDFFQCWQLSN